MVFAGIGAGSKCDRSVSVQGLVVEGPAGQVLLQVSVTLSQPDSTHCLTSEASRENW